MNDVTTDSYDVVVVGSGAGGGMAAYRLCEAGVKVCLVEAGRSYDPLEETPMYQTFAEAPLRGVQTQDKSFNYYNATIGGWHLDGEPFTTADDTRFMWYRSRMLGGRTNHWGRHVPRFGPADFRPGSRDGLSPDWPISYSELAPFYTATERVVGVSGVNAGLPEHPDSPEGVLQPPPSARAIEMFIAAGAQDLNLPMRKRRNAILTRNLDNRLACFNATPCIRGCSIGAAFQSTTSLLPMAEATGNLTILTNAKVYEVETGPDGRATGVVYVDPTTGAHGRVRGRAVVLAASACSTARILLNSGGDDGLANSSGQVGRNLTDTVGINVRGQFPALEGRPRYDEFGMSLDHTYIPWWGYADQLAGRLDFPRGYHVEIGGGFQRAPNMGMGAWGARLGGYGDKLRDEIRRYYGSEIVLTGRGEMVPNANSYCELDPDAVDAWGIPVLRFNFEWSDYEYRQAQHMIDTFTALIERLGGTVTSARRPPREAISVPGEIIHEVGTTRMGADAGSSVCDESGRTWDVDNLYLMDGGVFTSNPHKNPTLTIMALAWRNSEKLARRLGSGDI